jgi:hypothetical protein
MTSFEGLEREKQNAYLEKGRRKKKEEEEEERKRACVSKE